MPEPITLVPKRSTLEDPEPPIAPKLPDPPADAPDNNSYRDHICLLVGAAMCFTASIIMALIRGADNPVVILVGAGATAIGALAGISRGGTTKP